MSNQDDQLARFALAGQARDVVGFEPVRIAQTDFGRMVLVRRPI